MSLAHFGVVHNHFEPMNRVLVQCFDGQQIVLVFISREAIDDYFHKTALTPKDRNLLIARNLDKLIPVIADKYRSGEVTTYIGPGGQRFPQIDLSLTDLEQASEKLSDSVLDIAAHAGFRGAHISC